MKTERSARNYYWAILVIIWFAFANSLYIAGCSGGGGGTASTPLVSQGVVTAIGSITVNGIKFDDTSANITGDNTTKSLADVRRVGVVVRVTGTRSSDGINGVAENIEINNEVRGTVTAKGTDNFTVLGQTIVVDGATVFINVADFSALQVGDRVEVHGMRMADGRINATRVEVTGSTDPDEVRGIVSGKTATTFVVGAMTINYDASTVVVPAGRTFMDGDLVEVHLNGSLAVLIEIEADYPEGLECEIEGYISEFTGHPGEFMVADVRVRTTATTKFQGGLPTDLANNIEVEAEGHMEAGVLVVEEIDFEDSVLIQDNASGVTADQLTLLGKTVLRTSRTSPNDVVADGDGVEAHGFTNIDGTLTALEIVNIGSTIAADQKILRGPVSSFDAVSKTFVIIGITVDASGLSVKFEADDDSLIDANTFFNSLVANRTVVSAKGTFTLATTTLTAGEVEIE